jgi:hypothetical protein
MTGLRFRIMGCRDSHCRLRQANRIDLAARVAFQIPANLDKLFPSRSGRQKK